MHIRTGLAAAAAAVALIAGGLAAAGPALACSAPANCTNGTVNVGSTIGTTGFPTSFTMTGNAGTTATATASAYSVFSNVPWTLSFQDDSTDVVNGSAFPAAWYVPPGSTTPSFPITTTTTITHNGTPFHLPAGTTGAEVTSVQIDSGGATAGGQNFADVFSVAIPSAQAPGQYVAAFQYVLAG